jgi:hypothetical protein
MKKFFVLMAFAVAAAFVLLPPKRRRLHKIYLFMPEIDGQTVIFRWRVEPMTTLYRRCSFRPTFPVAVDLSRVPTRLWCDILLICLHTHWLLLRPCEVHLPLVLSEPEKRFWLQLLQNAADTLESLWRRPRPVGRLGIQLIDGALQVP